MLSKFEAIEGIETLSNIKDLTKALEENYRKLFKLGIFLEKISSIPIDIQLKDDYGGFIWVSYNNFKDFLIIEEMELKCDYNKSEILEKVKKFVSIDEIDEIITSFGTIKIVILDKREKLIKDAKQILNILFDSLNGVKNKINRLDDYYMLKSNTISISKIS